MANEQTTELAQPGKGPFNDSAPPITHPQFALRKLTAVRRAQSDTTLPQPLAELLAVVGAAGIAHIRR